MRLYVSIRNESDRQQLQQLDGKVLVDYGHAVLLELDESKLSFIKEKGLRFRQAVSKSLVKLNGYRVDLSSPSVRTDALRGAMDTLPGTRGFGPDDELQTHVIIQLIGAMHPDWSNELKGMNIKIETSLGNDGYLVSVPEAQLARLSQLSYVDSVGDYLPQLKVSMQLLTPEVESTFGANDALQLDADLSNIPDVVRTRGNDSLTHRIGREVAPSTAANVVVVLFDASKRDETIQRLQTIPQVGVIETMADTILVTARPPAIIQIASLPNVRTVEPNLPRELHNNVAMAITRAGVVRSALNLDGSGQIVGVADTGLDTGSTNSILADFSGRIDQLIARGRSISNDPNGHGTHVAGSILGNGATSNSQVQGMAPAARLVFQSVLDSLGGLRGLGVLDDLFTEARDFGARIHNNSWGIARSDGAYMADSERVDQFAFAHGDFLIVFSAGNDGPNLHITAPGTAKNALTVGASKSVRAIPATINFPPSPRFSTGATISGLDQEANSDQEIAFFSCRGPCENNRRKPDVVAPGTWILSTRSSAAVADRGPDGLVGLQPTPSFPTGGTGDEDGVPTHAEAVGSGLPGGPIFGGGNGLAPALPSAAPAGAATSYMYLSGTSMAAPITTGCCALMRQYFIDRRGHTPSAALIKATIVGGAVSVHGIVPDNDQGWGRVAIDESIQPLGRPIQFDDDINHAVSTSQIRTFEASVGQIGQEVKVTLVWRDPPGRTIQNKLHLRVFDGASNVELSSDSVNDIRNNVQRVSLKPTQNLVRIEVEGINITTGIPGGAGTTQDFALVVSNASTLIML